MSETLSLINKTVTAAREALSNHLDIMPFSKSISSLSRKTQEVIFYFPVIISDSIALENLTMVSKALERQYATYVRLAAGIDDEKEDYVSKSTFLKKFHKNTYTDMRYESANLIQKNKTMLEPYKEDLELSSLNSKTDKNNINYNRLTPWKILKEAKGKGNQNQGNRPSQPSNPYAQAQEQRAKDKHQWEANKEQRDQDRFTMDKQDWYADNKRADIQLDMKAAELGMKDQDLSIKAATLSHNREVFITQRTAELSKRQYDKQLLDNDVKKSNELVPTLLNIEVISRSETGHSYMTNIILGIKTVAHSVTSNDMIFNITNAIEEGRFVFRTIKWLTGEISFFKDFLLNLDNIKKSVLQRRSGSNWWRVLKNRALSRRIASFLPLKEVFQPIPNSTIVMSIEETDFVKNNYNIDLLKDIPIVNKLCDEFFLMGFVVVDSAAEIVYFKFDGETDYQKFSFNSLERENKNSGNEMKAMLNLMRKI